jgi:hypothetical protein
MLVLTSPRGRRIATAALLAVGSSTVAAAPAAAVEPPCSTPALTQAYARWGDTNWYTLAPGETRGDFNGRGWFLLGGARVVATQLADGSSAHVLELPPGGEATSPPFCINSTYRTARAMTRSQNGSASAVVYFTYGWGRTAANPVAGGSAWAPTPSLNLNPSGSGWQLAKFTLVAGWGRGVLQVYDLYVDPYSRR